MPHVAERKKLSLRDLRLDAGFDTQMALAEAANVAQSTVWFAENGKTISYRSAYRIVKALKSKRRKLDIHDIEWSIREEKVR